MNLEQGLIFSILFLLLVFFTWGRWRYDIVAFIALLVTVFLRLVPANEAFSGFGNPAVITVAAVLVVSKGLLNSGLIDIMARMLGKIGNRPTLQLAALLLAVTLASGFMNNIGALALFMPVAIKLARKYERSPSLFLMPLAFCSLLGGMLTEIGTPPNILISAYREQLGGTGYRLFDFFPVGAGISILGIVFILVLGRYLIPERKGKPPREELFKVEDYIAEIKVDENSKYLGKTAADLEEAIDANVDIIGFYAGQKIFPLPLFFRGLRAGDSVLIRSDAVAIQELLDVTGLKMGSSSEDLCEECLRSEEISVIEAAITPNSPLVGNSVRKLNLRSEYNINLLGIAREGSRLRELPERVKLKAGDVLLLQGGLDSMQQVLTEIGALPLAERGLRIGKIKKASLGVAIFGSAIALAVMNIVPVQIAFSLAAVVMVLTDFVSLRELYTSIEWPVIVLLGALLPVSNALETTGGAELIAAKLLAILGEAPAPISLAAVLIITILLSNIVNNAAALLIMAPIAAGIATGLGVATDPFLMAVAVGASSPFLTPIGHQSNTLVMEPGGYRFGDYWRLGLPLTIVVVAAAIPLLLITWPL